MKKPDDQIRVLMYSHDTFGLGHLRRTRAIAHALVEQHKGLSVLIISGSSIAGAFDFRSRVDFIKIPSVIKLRNGDYTSMSDHIDLSETLSMRRAIIESAAINFRPNVFIVDKEPRGLRGELDPTLPHLGDMGCEVVLGLREVLDAPSVVRDEWARQDAVPALSSYFDRIWIYGSKDFFDPLSGVPLPIEVRDRVEHVGFLARTVPAVTYHPGPRRLPTEFVLITAGGGGDGADLMSDVIAAKEHDKALDMPFVMTLGPYMSVREKSELRHRASRLKEVHVLDFDNRLEDLMHRATAVVAMGGYNTFCELMSFDKRAMIVPRIAPRQEQIIRAQRAAAHGLVTMLHPHEARDPWRMAAAIKALLSKPRPSQSSYKIDLKGLDRIGRAIGEIKQQAAMGNLEVIG